MKRLLICFAFTTIWINSISQKTVDVDKQVANSDRAVNYMYTVAGTPFVTAKFARVVEGSPFFNELMMPGAIILSEGREYKNIQVRLNLLDAQVNYIDDKYIEMIASTPVKEVVLWDTILKNDHRFIFSDYIGASQKLEKDFYELLQAGKAELYKQHKKSLLESKPYGSATVEQKIRTDTRYFLLVDRQWTKVKKLKDFATVFPDKKDEVLKFISDRKLSGDSEANFEAIVSYYNSPAIQQ